MMRGIVDFALKNRWIVLGGTVLLTLWGVLAFRDLPIEAYPDVANNYVQIITQWPGRSAEEIERQVTVPVEIQMAGIPHLTHRDDSADLRPHQRCDRLRHRDSATNARPQRSRSRSHHPKRQGLRILRRKGAA